MSLSISCLWALMGAFIYMVTLNLHRNLQSGCYYFQVTCEHMILEGNIHLVKVTQKVRGLACSSKPGWDSPQYDHHTSLWLVDGQTFHRLRAEFHRGHFTLNLNSREHGTRETTKSAGQRPDLQVNLVSSSASLSQWHLPSWNLEQESHHVVSWW